MTLGELALINNKILSAFRYLKDAYTGYKAIYLNIDASSWNNRFRDGDDRNLKCPI
jgi:hypothetical protein